jgi:hypothetical protein
MTAIAQLRPRQNSFNYVATLARPIFSLWDRPGALLAGLYDAYSDIGIGLRDISFVGPENAAAERGVAVNWGERSSMTLRLDRMEATIRNYLQSDLEAVPGYIERGEDWLRRESPEHRFATRLVTTSSHSLLNGESVEGILRNIGIRELNSSGRPRGHGASYHFEFPERSTLVDLMIDRSLVIDGGLYLNTMFLISGDIVDYHDVLNWGRATIDDLLSQIGLSFRESPPHG